jgi:hypothetical protein
VNVIRLGGIGAAGVPPPLLVEDEKLDRDYTIHAPFKNVTIRLPFEGKSSYAITPTRFDLLRCCVQQHAQCVRATAKSFADDD